MVQLPKALEQTLFSLVGEETGIIKFLIQLPLQSSELGIYLVVGECANTNALIDVETTDDDRICICGAALNREKAIWAAIGEACERYAAFTYHVEETILATENELAPNALPLSSFIAFSEQQYNADDFKYVKPSPHTIINWTEGFNLINGDKVYLPAQLVWLGFPSCPPAQSLFPQVSTGLAAGQSMHHAIISGLCEVIERDAFTTHWLLKRTPPKIRLSDVMEMDPELKQLLQHSKLDMHLLWMTTDIGIPCVLCVIKQPNNHGLGIGMSCNLVTIEAIKKAIVEALHCLNVIVDLKMRKVKATTKSQIFDFEDHIRYYLNKNNHPCLSFLFDGEYIDKQVLKERSFNNTEEQVKLNQIVKRLHTRGYPSYYVDTSLAEFTHIGIYTVKSFVPALQPLHLGVGEEYLEPTRLTTIAQFWGMNLPTQFNLEPHPFP